MILDDTAFSGAAHEAIAEHLWNAEWAMSAQAGQLAAQFEALEDDYLRERGRGALERDVLEFRAGLLVEQLRGELEHRRCAGVIGLVRVGLEPFDQFFEVRGRQRAPADQRKRRRGYECCRREISEHIELHRIDHRGGDEVGPRTDASGVAVGSRIRDPGHGDGAAGA